MRGRGLCCEAADSTAKRATLGFDSMSATRTVFLDVDGTLIGHDQVLAPSVTEAVRGARANGHLVYVCTGRSRAEIPPAIVEIGFDGYVSAAGGFVEHDGELLFSHLLPPDDVATIISFFETNGIEYNLQAFDATYPSRRLISRVAPMFARMGIDLTEEIERENRLTHRGPAPVDGISKATFFGEHQSTYRAVRDGLGERFHVITGTMPYLGEAGGEVNSPGTNKGSAIIELVDHLGRSVADAIAIGDSYNDVEMFEVAGLSIAMGNAVDEIKALADEVTTSVAEDGVWTAFRRHGLI